MTSAYVTVGPASPCPPPPPTLPACHTDLQLRGTGLLLAYPKDRGSTQGEGLLDSFVFEQGTEEATGPSPLQPGLLGAGDKLLPR